MFPVRIRPRLKTPRRCYGHDDRPVKRPPWRHRAGIRRLSRRCGAVPGCRRRRWRRTRRCWIRNGMTLTRVAAPVTSSPVGRTVSVEIVRISSRRILSLQTRKMVRHFIKYSQPMKIIAKKDLLFTLFQLFYDTSHSEKKYPWQLNHFH